MFTDEYATPTRLEVMIDLLRDLRSQQRTVDAEMLCNLLQPDGLPNLNPLRGQSKKVLQAAKELGLVIDDGRKVTLAGIERLSRRSTRDWVLEAFDQKVLSDTQIEPYFALFYSYMLVQRSSDRGRTPDEWARDFNRDVFKDQPMPNPFNTDKISGMHRWMRWAGLGWYDPKETFLCNPYDRIRRNLPAVFGDNSRLDDEAFISALGRECPELDSGKIFNQVCPDQSKHQLSAGSAQALVDLHLDGVITLHTALDASGWSLEQAEPVDLEGPRFHAVELSRRT
ncbi:MAG: hypothetical protein ACM359_12600 [Bacillota bacterium]